MGVLDTPKIVFQRPRPVGWYTVVFPHIHDLNTNIEVWVDVVFTWMDSRCIDRHGLFWALAHEKKKRKKGEEEETEDRVSPVFFFKDHWSAIQMKWRFSGEFTE